MGQELMEWGGIAIRYWARRDSGIDDNKEAPMGGDDD